MTAAALIWNESIAVARAGYQDQPTLLASRLEAHAGRLAHQNRYREALQLLEEVVMLSDKQKPSSLYTRVKNVAYVQAALGEVKAYHQTTKRLQAEFKKYSISFPCLLLPLEAGDDGSAWVKLTEANAKRSPESAISVALLGMALYRANRFKEAVQPLEQAEELHSRDGYVEVKFYLSMAYHKLGQKDPAARWLKAGRQQMEQRLAAGNQHWRNRAIWTTLRGEAEGLVK